MNIKPYDKTIRDLLGSKRQFLIPRFQREYSWDKKNYDYFVSQLKDDKLKALLKRKHGSEEVKSLSEIDILKALRDQVLHLIPLLLKLNFVTEIFWKICFLTQKFI